jgi:hypothetical protein
LVSSRLWWLLRVSTAAGVILLLAFVFSFAEGDHGRSALGNGLFQDYPVDGTATETGDDSYPILTDTPDGNSTQSADTPTAEFTATNTATLPPDVFRTEDSEMNQSQTTPGATETPGPTITGYVTPTVIKTQRGPTPTPLPKKEKNAFTLDWGMFLAGFSLPVLGACGYILYLLDRRPELFKRFRR